MIVTGVETILPKISPRLPKKESKFFPENTGLRLMAQSSHYPTVLIILGATGDLVRRKIAPALYNLYTEGLLPDNFQIVAFARREFSDEDYRAYLSSIITENHDTDPTTLH